MSTPVALRPLSPELFAEARAAQRLLVVCVAAPWNHWSQRLEAETLAHPAVLAALEPEYVAANLDADEHPELDRRLQDAVHLLGIPGGWPLCALITPEGQLAFGTTYLPPEDDARMKRKGLAGVLRQVATAWREQPAKLRELGGHIVHVLSGVESGDASSSVPPVACDQLVGEVVGQVERLADPHYAGLQGDGAKFPHPCLWELLLLWVDQEAWHRGEEERVQQMRGFAARSLNDMALSGLHDQLGDGFHRYCVDPYWNVPEFEKLASDNAALLRVYAQASRVLAEPFFAHVAGNTARWLLQTLLSAEGGFYHAVYATRPGDEPGLHYGWTLHQVQAALDDDEAMTAFCLYFGVHKQGDLLPPHQQVNILRVSRSVAEVAEELGLPSERVEGLLEQAATKMRQVRRERQTAPPCDERMFTASTAEVAYSLLQAARVLPDPALASAAQQQAVKGLERLLRDGYEPGFGMRHRLDEAGRAAEAEAAKRSGRRWLLADQAWAVTALLAGYSATAVPAYLDAARDLVALLNRQFWHTAAGGYYDVVRADPPAAAGAAGDEADVDVDVDGARAAWPALFTLPRRPVADSPSASGNGLMLRALIQLHLMTNDEAYLERARWVADGLGPTAQQRGFLASTFATAAAELEHAPPTAVVAGSREDAAAQELLRAARLHAPWSAAPILLDPDDPHDQPLAAAHGAELLDGKPALYVCVARRVKPPITEPNEVDADTFAVEEAS